MIPCTSTNLHEQCNGDIFYFSINESLEACHRAGFQAIDLDFHTAAGPGGPLESDSNWESWLERVKDKVEELGVVIPSCHSFFYVHDDRTDRNEELTRRSIKAAGMMGVPEIVVHPYSVCDSTWYSHKQSISENLEYLRRYADIARPYGTKIALENMVEDVTKRRFSSSPEDLLELIEALDDPIFNICWDFGHGERSGCNTVAALRQINSLLKVVHVHDWTINKVGFDHTIPFLGITKWDEIMPVLKEISFDGTMNLECQNFTRNLPAEVRPQALSLAYTACCELIKKTGY